MREVRAPAVLRGRPALDQRRVIGRGRRPAARTAATRLGRAGAELRRPALTESNGASRSAVSSASTVSPGWRSCARIAGIRAWSATLGLGEVDEVSVQLGDLHGEPSVLVRLAPHRAGQQFPVGLLDMVGVPSTGEHDAHLRGPVVDCAAPRNRAVEDFDRLLREVSASCGTPWTVPCRQHACVAASRSRRVGRERRAGVAQAGRAVTRRDRAGVRDRRLLRAVLDRLDRAVSVLMRAAFHDPGDSRVVGCSVSQERQGVFRGGVGVLEDRAV